MSLLDGCEHAIIMIFQMNEFCENYKMYGPFSNFLNSLLCMSTPYSCVDRTTYSISKSINKGEIHNL